MNTNEMDRTKGSNLSVTAKGQKNTSRANSARNSSGESKSLQSKDNSCNKSHECSGGVCSTTWKPVPHIA